MNILNYIENIKQENEGPRITIQEPRNMAQAPIAEDLEPGALRDEMLKGFDPSQETHEEYLQRINLERPFNAAQGGRIGFEDAGHVKRVATKKKQTTKKLFDFLANWTKDRKPTIMEVAKGSGTSTKSIKKYLKEGTDYTKTSHQEVSVKGGKSSGQILKKKIGAVDEVSEELLKKIRAVDVKGLSVNLEATKGGGQFIRLRLSDPALKGFGEEWLPATEENLERIKTRVNEIVQSDQYKKVEPFLTSEQELAIKRAKYQDIKKGDPENIYFKTQEKKADIFPGTKSKEKVIHHGKKKSLPQTTEKWFLIDDELNNLESLKKAEEARDGLYTVRNRIRDSKTLSNAEKIRGMDEINAKLKRIIKNKKFKSTKGKGLVDITLESMDETGKIISKDMGADISKSLGWKTLSGKLDLTKLQGDEGKLVLGELEKKLIQLGCGMYAGGRVGFKVGSGKCINRAIAKLKSGNLSAAEKKIVDAMGDGLKKGGMPKKFWTTALKGEGYFALADFANNLTKGQSLDKSFSNAVEMATFGALDIGGNERDLMRYAEERGLDTEAIKEWMDYAKTYGKYVEGHEDLAEREKIVEASGGEEEYGKNFQPNTILNPSADVSDPSLWEAEKKIERAEKQLEEQGKSESIQSGKGYKDMNEAIEGVIAKEWNKTAGTPLDRGIRKMAGIKGDEGLVWGPIGSMFREGMEKSGFGEHDALKGFTPQTVMNYHPVYGYKEDIKDVIRQGDSPMEDMLGYMEKNYPGSGLIQEALREVAKEKEVEKWVDTGFGREKRKVKTDMGSYDYDPNLAEGGIASLNVKK